jgi:aspartate carbamoyltransferase catalytic subunit
MAATMRGMKLSFPHLVSVEQVTRVDADLILTTAAKMEKVLAKGGDESLKGKILASLFYEPSTRTRLSFESAMMRLGGSIVTADGMQSSSFLKGESIEDTIRMASGYADVICMRHPEAGSAAKAITVSEVPFLNAGDGGNEHPTQALLDLYTIQKELGTLEGIHVAFSCDPLHSRTIRSLALMLSLYAGNRFTFISPESLKADPEFLKRLTKAGATYVETTDLHAGAEADVLYMNRLQKERFKPGEDVEQYRKAYCITADMLKGKKVLIMDPLPRVGEIAEDVDELPNAAYFRQAQNGVPVRMALLSLLLS